MDNEKSNVIPFPGQPEPALPISTEQLAKTVEQMREQYIEILCEDIMQFILFRTHMEGFDLTQEKSRGPVGFSVEAIKAALLSTVDIPHFMHDIVKEWTKLTDHPLPNLPSEDD